MMIVEILSAMTIKKGNAADQAISILKMLQVSDHEMYEEFHSSSIENFLFPKFSPPP
jgi:hypothetical protein